ncbi:unnamed protein product [Sphacelaria rigidula]
MVCQTLRVTCEKSRGGRVGNLETVCGMILKISSETPPSCVSYSSMETRRPRRIIYGKWLGRCVRGLKARFLASAGPSRTRAVWARCTRASTLSSCDFLLFSCGTVRMLRNTCTMRV